MTRERIQETFNDLRNAFNRLEEAVNEDLQKGTIVIDATIQRFEFTFELAWKLLRLILEYNGVETDTPRLVIKEGFKSKMLKDGGAWIDMLEDRNKTSHIYDEEAARKIYVKIKNSHLSVLRDFLSVILKFAPTPRKNRSSR